MSAAGVPLVEALESVAGATGNIVYYKAVMEMRENVATGQSLQYSMTQTHLFPNMVIQMLAIGEESGAIDKMLNKVADFYEEEVDNLVDNLSSACTKKPFLENTLLYLTEYFLNFDSALQKTHQLLRVF